jgi:hypothetical protein
MKNAYILKGLCITLVIQEDGRNVFQERAYILK